MGLKNKTIFFRVPLILYLESFLKVFTNHFEKSSKYSRLNVYVLKKLAFISIIINSSFILGKKLKTYNYIAKKINTIKFCNNQATAKLLGLFTPGPKSLSYIL